MKGKISINRTIGPNGHEIRITIEDKSSLCTFFEGRINLKEFAEALTGLSCQEIEYELHDTKHIGKKIEHKRVQISVDLVDIHEMWDQFNHGCRARVKEAVKPFEVDGWECTNFDDMFNWHYCHREGNTIVSTLPFYRWLDQKPVGTEENK